MMREEPIQEPTDAVAAVLQQALGEAEEDRWERSAELLLDALEEYPGDPYLLCWLGLAERELGEEGSAYERFRAALQADPRDPVLLATAGNAIAAFDDPAAEAALRTAALLAPNLPQARWMYGAYLAREGMTADALEELRAASDLDPEDPVIRMEIGVAHALSGEMEAAVSAFTECVEMSPEDGWGLILLGLARVELEEFEEAARVLSEGARLCPWDLEAQVLASLSLAASDREDLALEMLERARMQAEAGEAGLLGEVEERIEDGAEAALAYLRSTLGPSAFRERLLQRP
jgi:Flp pilus assembly protein TadD